jgi:hypothetical protein
MTATLNGSSERGPSSSDGIARFTAPRLSRFEDRIGHWARAAPSVHPCGTRRDTCLRVSGFVSGAAAYRATEFVHRNAAREGVEIHRNHVASYRAERQSRLESGGWPVIIRVARAS